MIPSNNGFLTENFTVEEQPSKTYKMNFDNKKIIGFCDNIQAIEQSIYKILNTERYENGIYSWNYGVEFTDLLGEPASYAIPEIKRRIVDALSVDSRILSLENFDFSVQKSQISVSFIAKTAFGNVRIERQI